MAVTINGSTGIAGVDGSAGTPSVQGTDSNTGIFFPAADTIAFAEGGAEVARFDSSGNLGIGTSSPGSKLQVSGIISSVGSGTSIFAAGEIGTYTLTGVTSPNYGIAYGTLTGKPNPALTVSGFDAIAFGTNQTERARIDSSGNLLVGTTSTVANGKFQTVNASDTAGVFQCGTNGASNIKSWVNTTSGTRYHMGFGDGSSYTERGFISTNGSSTTYSTTSDYRLKEDVQPMAGALARVAALKPVTYKWKADRSDGEGFIAHELQEVCPSAVIGEKDAVNEDGSIKPQGIDTSFLVATLTAAIQEQQALIESLTARIAALEAA